MEIGEQVPDFEATLHDGSMVTLSQMLADGPVVLFFFPRAFTSGCTVEACHFRDLADRFDRLGARRFGVSRDRARTQARFHHANELDYPLISDPSGTIGAIFGAKRLGPIPNRRHTYVVGTDRTLLGVIDSESNMERHADEAVEILQAATDQDDQN